MATHSSSIDVFMHLNISCFNARGIMPSTKYIERVLQQNAIDVLAISEHWLFPEMLTYLDTMCEGYLAHGVSSHSLDPYTSHRRGKGGVAIVYKKTLKHNITTISLDEDWICGLSLSLDDSTTLSIFSVYMPSSNYSNVSYSVNIEKLYDIYNKYGESSHCILLGDFNTEIRGDKCSSCTPVRGPMLIDFISNFELHVPNLSWHSKGPGYTFDPLEDHSVTSFIDFILLDKELQDCVSSCCILDDSHNPSDHLPVVCKLVIICSIDTPVNMYKQEHLKWNKCTDVNLEKYKETLSQNLNNIERPDTSTKKAITDYYDDLVDCIHSSAKTVIKAKKFKRFLKPFWGQDLTNFHKDMTKHRHIWLANHRPRLGYIYNDYKNAKRKFRRAFRNHQEKWFLDEDKEIEKTAEVDHNRFWALVNKKRKNKQKKIFTLCVNKTKYTTTSGILKGWHEHFTCLYSPCDHPDFDSNFQSEIDDKLTQYIKENSEQTHTECREMEETVNIDEIEKACKELRRKVTKVGGMDQLVYEHLIHGGADLYEHLALLFTTMLFSGTVPDKMKIGIIIALLKAGKKDTQNPNNYRGIILLPVIYKLFEKVTLKRMLKHMYRSVPRFPDPLQGAYQALLSSLNSSFTLLETIRYNTERGSNVFVCLLDTMKAFDYVWHNGLFISLYESGIKGKMWDVIRNSYTGMTSHVLHNGSLSETIPVLQSTRQGSYWGAIFFLFFINQLIKILRANDIGAHIMNIFCGAIFHADDIALVATNKHSLQNMINICYAFSRKWRFHFHPDKTKIIIYTKHKRSSQCDRYTWTLGDTPIDVVKSHTHCGVQLTSDISSAGITKSVCRKGRGIMLSLQNCGLGSLNPLTLLKLYKSIVLPSALFGCELWNSLSETEWVMLERMQRFCAKCMQKLGRQTRSDMCCPMLGLFSIRSYIDKLKLGFVRRLCALPGHAVSKQIFLQRYFQHTMSSIGTVEITGFSNDICKLLKKYDLLNFFEDTYLQYGEISPKPVWKKICWLGIRQRELIEYENRTEHDNDFINFRVIQPDVTKPNRIWEVAAKYPQLSAKCYTAAKCICRPVLEDTHLCEHCGRLYTDRVKHICCICDKYHDQRELFWNNLTNDFDVTVSAYMFNLEDEHFVNTLLGAPIPIPLQDDTVMSLIICFFNFLHSVDILTHL